MSKIHEQSVASATGPGGELLVGFDDCIAPARA